VIVTQRHYQCAKQQQQQQWLSREDVTRPLRTTPRDALTVQRADIRRLMLWLVASVRLTSAADASPIRGSTVRG